MRAARQQPNKLLLTFAFNWRSNGTRLRSFGTVLGATATTLINALAVKGATNNVIADTRKILHAAPTDQNDGVLLEIVTLATDVCDHFESIREANLGNFTQSRVWLLWCAGHHLQADAAALRALVQSRGLGLDRLVFAAVSDELIDGGHGIKAISV